MQNGFFFKCQKYYSYVELNKMKSEHFKLSLEDPSKSRFMNQRQYSPPKFIQVRTDNMISVHKTGV